jgi:hypothetical protein
VLLRARKTILLFPFSSYLFAMSLRQYILNKLVAKRNGDWLVFLCEKKGAKKTSNEQSLFKTKLNRGKKNNFPVRHH